MSFLPVIGAAKTASKVWQFINKNERVILTGMAVAGVVATVATTAQATVETVEILDDIHEEEEKTGVEMSNLEKAKAIAPKVVKAIAAAAATIVCIILAHKKGSEKIAAAMSALTLVRGKLLDQQQENELLRQQLGGDQADQLQKEAYGRQIRRQIDEVRARGVNPEEEIIDTGTGDAYFWDEFSGKMFRASRNYVEKALNHLQYRINNGYYGFGSVPYLEWINQLGIRGNGGAKWAEFVGWKTGSMLEMELREATIIEDRAYFVIHFRNQPIGLVA